MWRAFRDGVVTNLSNPKAIVFYASVFAGAVPVGATTGTLVAMVAMVPLIAVCWYGLVAQALSSERAAVVYRRVKPWIERSCGLLLIGFGVRQTMS
jgi:threonine efflux protein